jgi:O-antigen/teichoic acid export membrane protein
LTGGRRLARNTLLSIVGEAAPLILGIIAIPLLVRELGVERYGLLTLSTLVIGYLGLFDLGLGRAATQQVSNALGSDNRARVPGIFWTSLLLMFLLGILAAALLAGLSNRLVLNLLNIPLVLQFEGERVFLELAVSLPFIISGSSLSGTLVAYQRFDYLTSVGASVGLFSFAAPLAMLAVTHNLVWIVAVLVLGRLSAWSALFVLCLRTVPELTTNFKPSRTLVRPLLSFGGWITISGIASPMMAYFDRFVIASVFALSSVSYYTVPYQIVNKLGILSGAMAGVLFPAFSATAQANAPRASLLFERGTRYSVIALFPGLLLVFVFAPEILTGFFGADLARHAIPVIRCLVPGVFVNSLAFVPGSLVLGINRPDLPAKFHLLELPIYLVALFLLLPPLGITGVAIAWSLRVALDAGLFYTAATMLLPETRAAVRRLAGFALLVLVNIGTAGLLTRFEFRLVYVAFSLMIYFTISWLYLLEPRERAIVVGQILRLNLKGIATNNIAG